MKVMNYRLPQQQEIYFYCQLNKYQMLKKKDLVSLSKVKVNLSLCLTKHKAMNVLRGGAGMAPRILDLDTRKR
jgi:hypothetical protein